MHCELSIMKMLNYHGVSDDIPSLWHHADQDKKNFFLNVELSEAWALGSYWLLVHTLTDALLETLAIFIWTSTIVTVLT